MKIFRRENRLSWILTAIMFIIALAAFPFLPDRIPIHFNGEGAIDGTGSRIFIFLMPAVAAPMLLLGGITRQIDPRHQNYRRFQHHYYLIFLGCCLLFFMLELYTIAVCLSPQLEQSFSMGQWMPVLVGALIALCGNVLPKFKPNYFAGIKTPWTLANENVWYLTHRFTGKIWFGGGILLMLVAFLPSQFKTAATLILLIALIFIPYVYSYLAFRQEKKNEE